MAEQSRQFFYIASYPKSGNTWCRAFVSQLLQLENKRSSTDKDHELNLNLDIETGRIASARILIDDQLGVNSCDLSYAEVDLLRGDIGCRSWPFDEGKKFHKMHDAFYSPDSRGRPVASIRNCSGVIYILRHPEDITVSMSHYFTWPIERCVDFMLNPAATIGKPEWIGGQQVRQYLGRWDQHVLSWTQQQLIPVLIVRYEDMLANGAETFQEIASFLRLPSDSEKVREALERISMTRLQEMERKLGGFREKPKNCERFFRSGRSGEGALRLTKEDRQRLSECFAEVMKTHGYEAHTHDMSSTD